MNPFRDSAEKEVQGRAPLPTKDFQDSGLGTRNQPRVGLRGLEKNISPRPIEMNTCRTLAPSAWFPLPMPRRGEGGMGRVGSGGGGAGGMSINSSAPGWPSVPSPLRGLEEVGEGAPYCACLTARDAETVSRCELRGQVMEKPARPTQDTGLPAPRELGSLRCDTYHAESDVRRADPGTQARAHPPPPVQSARPKSPTCICPIPVRRVHDLVVGPPELLAAPNYPTPRNPDFCLACAFAG